MSKKRRHVEIESDLNNTESEYKEKNKVEDPSKNDSTYHDSTSDSESKTNGGQERNNSFTEDNQKNEVYKPNNEVGNSNNKVFEENSNSEPANNTSDSKNVESDNNSNLNNRDNSSNTNESNPETKDNVDDEKKQEENKSSQNDGKDSNSENKDIPENKVTDSSEQFDEKDSKIKQTVNEKLGEYSDTANKLNKVRDFKKLKNMSKDQAKQEVLEVGKEFAKKKVIALLMTYVAPYALPIILGILAIILIIIVIISAITGSGDKHSTKKQGCKVVNENSTNISVSKDAMKNAEKIYEYEMKNVKGAKPKSVAAHLGNMDIESGHTFDPKTIQGGNSFKEDIAKDGSVGGYAFGIAQWDSERRVNLIKYAESKDKEWSDFGIQLDFMLNHDGADSDTIKKLLRSDDSIGTTTERIMNEWERAGDKDSISQRKSAASKFYAKFSKKDIDSEDGNLDDATDAASDNSDAAENSGCDTESAGGKGEIGESVKANDGSGKIKEQWGSKKEIPEKYRKHIKLPDFKEEILDSPENIFPTTGNKGQCTELTWGYMKQLYGGTPPSNGNGNVIYKAYEDEGAKITSNPTVGYGFSSDPPHAGATDASVGHTGIVVGVMDNGDWIMANYNLNGEGNNGQKRVLTYALVDGNKKSGGIKFFSGVGKPKVKSQD